MKVENYHFPQLKESEAMFENSDIAPEWRDDKECFRCRQVFTTFIRKVIVIGIFNEDYSDRFFVAPLSSVWRNLLR